MTALEKTGLSAHEAMVAVDGLGSLFAIATATVDDLVSCRPVQEINVPQYLTPPAWTARRPRTLFDSSLASEGKSTTNATQKPSGRADFFPAQHHKGKLAPPRASRACTGVARCSG